MTFIASRDGTQLCEHTWSVAPGTSVRGDVVIVHGYGEHAGRYGHVADALTGAGFRVRALDLRGHGQSAGARGFVRRFWDYLDDVQVVVERARAQGQGQPLFLLGHSLGGLIVPSYALRDPSGLKGLVITSPYLRNNVQIPVLKLMAARLLSGVAPALPMATGLSGADVTRDEAMAANYERDPLNNRNGTPRWFTETTATQAEVLARAGQLRLPTLLLHGEADSVADPAGTRALYEGLASTDKSLEMYPDQRHELLNELEPDRVRTIARIIEWLGAHCSSAASSEQEPVAPLAPGV